MCTMTSLATSDSCVICNKPNALRCNRCKGASYCSKLCQRGDYPIHKLLCKSFSNFDTKTRPTDEHVRAILFPTDQKQPKLIWLRCEWREPEDEYETRYQYPHVRSFLNSFPQMISVRHNPVLSRQLSNTVCISLRDAALVDGSVPNSSIATITATATSARYFYGWHGPVVAYGVVGLSHDPDRCRDVDLNDFRHIADHFVSYGSDLISSTPDLHPAIQSKIKGVKINCLGDQKLLGKPQFEEIELASTDCIFTEHDTSDIAKRIGLPIFTRRCFPHPNWANVNDSELFGHKSPFNNQDATFLHLCCDPKAKFDLPRGTLGWGFASTSWQNNVGTTIIVRQDKKPLSRWHAEALCGYCRHQVLAYMAHSNGEYAPDEPMSKDLVLSMICRPTFSIYWENVRREKYEKGQTLPGPSPYDV